MKRIAALLMILILIVGLSACRGNTVSGVVTIKSASGKIILDTDISVPERGATAADAVKAACADVRLSYTYQNGMFDHFDGIASTKEEGWLFYGDGTLAEVGAGSYPLADGFVVEFRYENYNEAFTLE